MGAIIKRDGIPAAALRKALQTDRIALSQAVEAELLAVLARPRLARFIDPVLREDMIGRLLRQAARFEPTERITACRDQKDDIYLELAIAAQAPVIVSSDDDLLVMHPWRGVQILRPATYLDAA